MRPARIVVLAVVAISGVGLISILHPYKTVNTPPGLTAQEAIDAGEPVIVESFSVLGRREAAYVKNARGVCFVTQPGATPGAMVAAAESANWESVTLFDGTELVC